MKNTKGFVWTDKIENVETCLNNFQNKWSDRWHGEKIKSLEKEIKDKHQSISYYKDLIKQYEASIVEIQ